MSSRVNTHIQYTHLQSGAVVGETTHTVEREVDELFADGVVTARVVVRRVLFASDHLLRVEELLVRASAHFVCAIIALHTKSLEQTHRQQSAPSRRRSRAAHVVQCRFRRRTY
jgi:hypothetical protein